jgi:peptidoglycan/LPS O-acetylase OafA/YrhL
VFLKKIKSQSNVFITVFTAGLVTVALVCALASFTVTVIKHPGKKQLRGERTYFGSQLQVTVHHCGEVMVAGD